MISISLILFLSYLAGSIPASIWIGKLLYGVDVRQHGSRNAGATNAFRVLGWKTGILSTLIDIGKGLLAAGVLAAIQVDELPVGFWQMDSALPLLAGISAILGHMFPVWAGFRGGKGVNTAAGVLFAITPKTMCIIIAIFALVLFVFRYVSLASIVAAIMFPATVAIQMYVFHADTMDWSLLLFGGIFAVAILYAHRGNIQRLIAGKENRIKHFRFAHGMRGRGEI